MSEVLKWHREAGIEMANETACGIMSVLGGEMQATDEMKCAYASTIAAHDPTAELLRECAKAMRRAASQFDYLLDEFDDDVAGLSGPHSLSTSEVATRTNELRAALARLKEAGVE